MKKNDLLRVYEDLLSFENQRFLIALGVAAFNETVRVFERAKLIRRDVPAHVDKIRELALMVREFHRRFQPLRSGDDLLFRRLAGTFQRDLRERTDYEYLRARCQELPNLFSVLLDHWNGIKHRREVPSMIQVLALSSSIQRVLELAPPAFARERTKDTKTLRRQCELAQEWCRPQKRSSEAVTRRSGQSRFAPLSVDFPRHVDGPVARISLGSEEPEPPMEFQIDSVDSSFTTGRQRLAGKRDVDVRLAWHGENRFQVWTFDALGVPFHRHGPFGIVRTEGPPGAMTAARSLLLSVAGSDGRTFSEWLVRKGDPLPVERQCALSVGVQPGPEPPVPSVTVCESNHREAEGGLRPLGRVPLSPEYFPAWQADAEVEIRCHYRVADPGHLRLSISVAGAPPEARLTRVFAYSHGKRTESPAVELARECQNAFAQAADEIEIIEDLEQIERELRDPGSDPNPDLTETEELLYGLQVELIEMARQILGIEPSDTIAPLDEWLGAGGDFDFVGPEEKRVLMASPEYVTLMKEAAAIAETTEFVRTVLPTRGCWSALQFRELLGRMNGVPSSLANGPLDRPAYLGCIEAGYRALRDADLGRLQRVVEEMSELLPDDFCRRVVIPTDVERPVSGGTAARWLPSGWEVDGRAAGRKVDEGHRWQRYETSTGHVVVVTRGLADWWVERGLLEETALTRMEFGDSQYAGIPDQLDWDDDEGFVRGVGPIAQHFAASDQLRVARSIAESRRCTDVSFHDAIYSAKHRRVLPTLSGTPGQTDDVVLGCCLTGGLHVPASSMDRMKELTVLDEEQIREVLRVGGLPVGRAEATTPSIATGPLTKKPVNQGATFRLPGRPAIEAFFNEEIIEAARLAERHPEKVPWPGGVVLHGPPGCGKTFAVERLIAFLDWEVFRINSGTVGSPYIHETSRKVAEVFEKAREAAPSVVVIDEMEAFLSARETGASSRQHHLEEVGEFLRRIQEASSQRILVVGMTNRLDLIDPAVVRTGRFDRAVEVGMPSAEEVEVVLRERLSDVQMGPGVTLAAASTALAGRPLSDAASLVDRIIRQLAKANENESEWILDNALLRKAIGKLPVMEKKGKRSSIGFRPTGP